MRVTEDSVRRGWASVRHGVHVAGQIDNAVRVAGRAYTAPTPLVQAIDDHRGSNVHAGATRAFNDYHRIARLASRAEGYRTRITDDLRRAAPELGV